MFRVEILPGTQELAERSAEVFSQAVERAIAQRGRCALALSRPTPAPVFRRLDRADLEWERVDVLQVDERVAPDGDDERNLTLIQNDLASALGKARLHPMPVTDHDLDPAAERYSALLRELCGDPPVIDVVHLGLGEDGHTASLSPGEDVLEVDDRDVAATGQIGDFRRMTLTYPALARADRILMVVSGESKADALRRMLTGDPEMTAARVENDDALCLVDADAASKLEQEG